MSWTFPNKCFNFRNTGTFVTEVGPTNNDEMGICISAAGSTSSIAGNYPQTYSLFIGQSGEAVTGGWVTNLNVSGNDRNATPGDGIEFAGTTQIVNTDGGNPHQFRIDLPAGGNTFTVSVAMGAVTGTQNVYYSILDGTTVLQGPFSFTAVPADSYRGSLGNVVTSPASYAAWVAATDALTYAPADTGGPGGRPRLFINIGDPAHAAAGNTTIAHLRIVQGPPPLLLMGQICT
jgi:hypothetical protein